MNHDHNHNLDTNHTSDTADQDFYNSLKNNHSEENHSHSHDVHAHHVEHTDHGNHSPSVHDTSSHTHDHGHNSHDTSSESEEENGGSKIIKVIVILGILILLFFISIGIVRFVPKAIGSLSGASVYLSNLFSNEGVSLSFKDKTIESNSTLTVQTKNTSKEEGELAWSFACTEGVSLFYKSVDGAELPVVCETWFPLKEDSYTFMVSSKNNTSTDVNSTLSLFKKDTGDIIASDSVAFTVKGLKKEDTTTATLKEEGKESPTYTPAQNSKETPSNKNQTNTENTTGTKTTSTQTNTQTTQKTASVGPTDLSITLMQANTIRQGSLNVGTLSNVSQTDKVYLRFKVTNNGINKSDAWKLSTELPTLTVTDRFYTSRYQPSLNPGQSVELTMMFDNFDSSKNTIKITVDNPTDTLQSNNVLSVPISGNGNITSTSGSRADLVVRISDVGVMNGYNNFVSSSNIYTNDTVAVKFEVSNIGRERSGYYDIKINFPTEDEETRYFNSRSPIAPGATSYFTVLFENPEAGRNDIEIEVDSGDDVRENSESNNDTSRTIRIND